MTEGVINIDYLGLKCGVCGKDFKKDDDVVVCPDCGTPSHRVCYKENKGCPNADKHGGDFIFDGFEKIKKSAQGVKKKKTNNAVTIAYGVDTDSFEDSQVSVRKEISCPYCGELNKSEANYCNRCGAKFVKIQPVPVMESGSGQNSAGQQNPFTVPQAPKAVPYMPDPLSGVPANAVFEENVTAAELASFVAINTPYYMRVFDQHKRNKKKFNLAACLFSGIWFLYRKLYKIGALIFSIEMLLYAIRYYITQSYGMEIMNKLADSVVKNPDQGYTFEQYMQMSDKLMELPANEQLMFMLPSLLFFVQLIIMIVCGIIGNRLYYSHCIKRIQSIKNLAKEENLDKQETAQVLYLGGGVNPFVAGAFSLLYLILFR